MISIHHLLLEILSEIKFFAMGGLNDQFQSESKLFNSLYFLIMASQSNFPNNIPISVH
jgi:hypothetical protein